MSRAPSPQGRKSTVRPASINATRGNKEAHDYLHGLRQEGPAIIRARIARGVSDGDVPAGAPVADLASFYATVVQGLALRARDGASRQALMAVADAAMAAWDPLVEKPRSARAKETRARAASTARRARRS